MIKKAMHSIVMSRRMSKIAWVLFVTVFSSCREQSNVSVVESLLDSKHVSDKEIEVEADSSLYKLYKAVMDTAISDENNFDIIRRNFFSVKVPEESAYCFYFRFIQVNQDASLSEEVSINSFKMWQEDKQKGEKILKYVDMLPIDIRGKLFNALVQAMCLDLNANGYNLELFKRDFSFLKDSVSLASAKSCFESWVE